MLFQPAHSAHRAQALLLAILFGVINLLAYTGHNDFSFLCHPDEPTKVRQVATGERNFNHPLLMLNTASVAARVLGAADDRQQIAVIGRWLSALYMAGAVEILTFLGWRFAGLMGAMGVGLSLGVDNRLYQYAHFFKEDPALLFGLALFLLGADMFSSRPRLGTSILLGLGAGAAFSAKYLGAITILLGLALVMAMSSIPSAPRAADVVHGAKARASGWRRSALYLALFLLAALALFAACNYQLFQPEGFARLTGGLSHEQENLQKLQEVGSLPNWDPVRCLLDILLPAMWICIVGNFGVDKRRDGRTHPALWVSAAIPLLLTAILVASPRDADRYYLPLSAFLSFLFGTGSARISDWLGKGTRWKILIFVVVLGVHVQQSLPRILSLHRSFATDTRKQVAEYVRTHLPHDAVIAYDGSLGLPNPGARGSKYDPEASNGPPLPQRVVLGEPFVARLGTIDQLGGRGVTHIAVSRADYMAFKSRKSDRTIYKDWRQIQQFYDALFEEREARIVRKWNKGEIPYVEQEFYLFEIRPR